MEKSTQTQKAKSVEASTWGVTGEPFDRFIRGVLYGTAFLLPLVFFPWQGDVFSLAKVTVLRAAGLLIISAFLLKYLHTKEMNFRVTSLDLPILVFLLFAVISTVFSVNPTTSMFAALYRRNETLPTWVAYLVLFFAASNFITERRDFLRLLKIMTLGSAIVSLYAIFQSFGYDFFSFEAAGFAKLRAIATFGNPVSLGAYLTLILPVSLGLFLAAKSWEKLLWAALSFLTVSALVFTYSRGAWLGVIVGLVSFLILVFALAFRGSTTAFRSRLAVIFLTLLLSAPLVVYTVNHLGALAGALAGVAILVFLAFLVGIKSSSSNLLRDLYLLFLVLLAAAVLTVVISQNRSATSTLLTERVETATRGVAGGAGRFPMWRETFSLIAERPLFGWGLETLKDTFPYYNREFVEVEGEKVVDRPHNQLLYVAYSTGVLGLLAFLWIFIGYLRGVLWLRHLEEGRAVLFAGAFSSVLGYLAQEQFFFSVVGVTSLLWTLMGATTDASLFKIHGWKRNLSLGRVAQWLLGASLVFLTGLSLWYVARAPLADYFFRVGERREALGDYIAANEYFYRAVKSNPWESRHRFAYGQNVEALAMGSRDATWIRKALPVYLEGLRKNPRDYDLYFGLGNSYYTYAFLERRADYGEAMRAYREAIKLRPYNPEPYYWLGLAYLQEGKYETGVGYLKKALELGPGQYGKAPVLFALAQGYARMGEIGKAVSYLEETLKEDPGLQAAGELLKKLKGEK